MTQAITFWQDFSIPTDLEISLDRETIKQLLEDRERLDWLENNLFSREPDNWDRKYGMCRDGDTNQWALFAPKGVQGSSRAIIDAAMARDNGTSISGDTK